MQTALHKVGLLLPSLHDLFAAGRHALIARRIRVDISLRNSSHWLAAAATLPHRSFANPRVLDLARQAKRNRHRHCAARDDVIPRRELAPTDLVLLVRLAIVRPRAWQETSIPR